MPALSYAERVGELSANPLPPGSPQARIRDELNDMACAGYDWEMFSSAGNAACSVALATTLSRGDVLTVDTLVPMISSAIVEVAAAGHREVGDTEPEIHFEHAANLVADLCGWPRVSRFEFTAHLAVLDADAAVKREAAAAAAAALIERHRDEYEQLVAAEVAQRRG